MTSRVAWIAATAVLATACRASDGLVSSLPERTSTEAAVASTVDLVPVSISNPSLGAKDAFAKCHIGDQYVFDQIAGMGEVPVARDLLHYVPLSGSEPQLREAGPAWVIQFRGDTLQRSEVWTDPICVVTASSFGFYATGPVKDLSSGKVHQPEAPASPPDRSLPRLVP